MFEEPKGSGEFYKVLFFEGAPNIGPDENGISCVQGDVIEIHIDEVYWKDFYRWQKILEFNQIVPSVDYPAKPTNIGIRDVTSKYYVSRTLHELVIKLCKEMDIDARNAESLMVPLSDMFFDVTTRNAAYSEGLKPEANQLMELIKRIRHPGVDPNKRKKDNHERSYFPSISGVTIRTGWLKKISKKSVKRELVEDTRYDFKHDAILNIFQQIFTSAFLGENGQLILNRLSSIDESYRTVPHISLVYNYIVDHDLFRRGHKASRPDSIHNDACKKTAFLVDIVKAHIKWEYCLQRDWKDKAEEHLAEKEALIVDLEQGVTQDLAKKYYHVIKSL